MGKLSFWVLFTSAVAMGWCFTGCQPEELKVPNSDTKHTQIGKLGSEVPFFSYKQEDGSYLLGGTVNFDVFLLKTNAYGKELWYTTSGFEDEELLADVCQTPDGGSVAVGFSRKTDLFGLPVGFAIKFSSNGVVEWKHQYALDSGSRQAFANVESFSDGKLLIHAIVVDSDVGFSSDRVLILDESGDILFKARPDISILSTTVNENNQPVLVGKMHSPVSAIRSAVMDKTGNIINNHAIRGLFTTKSEQLKSPIRKTENGYSWINAYEKPDGEEINELVEVGFDWNLKSRTLVDDNISGFGEYKNTYLLFDRYPTESSKFEITSLDDSKNTLWKKAIGTTTHGQRVLGAEYVNNEWIISGYSTNNNTNTGNFIFYRLDVNGNLIYE